MNGCPSRSTPPKATWRRSSTLTARRAPDVTTAQLLARAIAVPVSQENARPHHRVDLTDRAGLSHQPRRLRPVPAAAARMSGAHTAQAQPLPRQSQADCPRPQQASRSTPGQRRNPACQPRTHTRNRRPQLAQPHAKNVILFKGAQPSTSPGAPGSTTHSNPNNSHPTGNHHPHHHTNSTTSHPSDALQSSAGRPTPSSAPFPGWSSSRCRAPNRETRTT